MRRLAATLVATLPLLACSPGEGTPVAPAPQVHPEPREFRFETLDGKDLSSATLTGRVTVIGFAATYDLPSQALARYLALLAKRHRPRLNVALLVLEPPDNRPLVQAFVDALALPYPVAFADADTIAGLGPFSGLHHVPSLVILDRRCRETWRHVGLATEQEIDEAVATAERVAPAGP